MCNCNLVACNLDKFSQSVVDRSVATKDLGDIGVNFDKVCAGAIALDILSSYATLHVIEFILSAKPCCVGVILFHSVVSLVV